MKLVCIRLGVWRIALYIGMPHAGLWIGILWSFNFVPTILIQPLPLIGLCIDPWPRNDP